MDFLVHAQDAVTSSLLNSTPFCAARMVARLPTQDASAARYPIDLKSIWRIVPGEAR